MIFQHRTTNKTLYPNSLMILHNGLQSKHPYCSKTFTTGPSKIGNVVCQMENCKLNPTKTKVIIFSRSILARKTELNLKLYRETLKIYPQVKFLGITFDSQLTFKKHFEEILDRCNTRYHRLRLLVNKKWGPSPATMIQIYNASVQFLNTALFRLLLLRLYHQKNSAALKQIYTAYLSFTKIHLL